MAVIWERGLYRKGTGEGTSPLRQPNFGRLISLNRDLEKISIALIIHSLDLLQVGVGNRNSRLLDLAIEKERFFGARVELRKGGA